MNDLFRGSDTNNTDVALFINRNAWSILQSEKTSISSAQFNSEQPRTMLPRQML